MRRKTSGNLTSDQLMYLVCGPDVITWGHDPKTHKDLTPFEDEAAAIRKYAEFKNRIAKRVYTGSEDLFTHIMPGEKPWAWYASRGEKRPRSCDWTPEQLKGIAEFEAFQANKLKNEATK